MKKITYRYHHRGVVTGGIYPPDRFLYTDPKTGEILLVERDETYIKRKIGTGRDAQNHFDGLRFGPQRRNYPNNSGVWLWRQFILPGFPKEAIVSLNEGQTDLFEVPGWLKKEIGLNNLFIKMEGRSPSESFKDRGMPVAVSDALRLQLLNPEHPIVGVCCASTGDTSAAAAIYAAYCRDKLSCVVLLPFENISDSQLFQAIAHRANVIAVKHPDGFDGCMYLIREFQRDHPEYVLVNSANDMRVVGQETIGLEIIQDLEWKAPDWIAIPVGNGGNLTALMIGLLRAKEFGLIDRLPGIIAAQTESADTLVRWQGSGYQQYQPGKLQKSVATAMNINDPVSFPRIKSLHDQFNIHFIAAGEFQIKKTWARFMGAGANICPQSAVALSAVLQARAVGVVKEDDMIVSISTASGIKFSEAGIAWHKSAVDDSCNPYKVVSGNLHEIEAALK